MKKVIVTGCAGFIGSHTAKALLDKGFVVVGIDNVNDYYPVEFKEQNLNALKNSENFVFHKVDITNQEELEKVFKEHKDCHTIIHLAARAGVRPSIENPSLYQKVNVEGTQNVLDCAKAQGVKNVILASSSSVYGNQEKTPFSEEDDVASPISPYAATKRSVELLAYPYHHLFGLNIVALRFFTVYGEAGRPDMAPYIFTKAILEGRPIKKFGDGTTKRDYTYVSDIVAGIEACIDKNFGYEIINLGNNKPVSLNEFIETLEKITGKEMKVENLPMQPGDVNVTFANISKAKRILGWEPKVSFASGMEKFIRWYKENRMHESH